MRSSNRANSMHRAVGAVIAFMMLWPAWPTAAVDWLYTVRPGDTFWSVTESLLDGHRPWQALAEHNGVAAEAGLRAGQRLRIPVEWLEVTPTSAKVARLAGVATRTPAGDAQPEQVAVGDALNTGDRLEVAADGYVVVVFADESRLLVTGGTQVTFDAVGSYGSAGMVDTSMRLHGGRVDAKVNRQRGPAGNFHVRTPAAIAAVRGTDFRVGYDASEGVAFNEVEEGSVAVSGGSRSVRVAGGFGLRVERGAPVTQPVPLLSAPDLEADAGDGIVNALQELTTMGFSWTPIDGASAYRTRFLNRASPPVIIAEALVDRPRWVVAAPPDGEYRLTVRPVAADGLEGLTSEIDVVVDALPLAPQPVAPLDQATTHTVPPELRWGKPDGTVAPRLQVASDEAFANLLFDERLRDGSGSLRPALELAPGQYWWRLSGFAADGEEGPYSETRSFEMLIVPAAAEAGEADVSEGSVALQWPAVPFAVRYRVEVATDREFEDTLADQVLEVRELALQELESGNYYYRVRGISEDDVEGPVSPVTEFEVPQPPLSPWMLIIMSPLIFVL